MLFEHLIYSTAIAIEAGMVYYRYVGRDPSWIIIASAYAPDIDMIIDPLLRKMGISLIINGDPIIHGNFHNIVVLIVYSRLVAFLLHPLISDSLIHSFCEPGLCSQYFRGCPGL